ncbi:MAG: putative metal-binding motif-containing protein [Planctomycetota bacterium]
MEAKTNNSNHIDTLYTSAAEIDLCGKTTFDVPDLTGVRRIRFQGNDVLNGFLRVCDIYIGGSFEEIEPRLNESRQDNNQASAFLTHSCGGGSAQAPLFISAPPASACADSELVYDANADDREGSGVTYSLVEGPIGAAVDSVSGVLRWAVSEAAGTLVDVVLRARSGSGAESTQEFTLVVERCGNTSPRITSAAPESAQGLDWCHLAEAEDVDGDRLSWVLLSGPSGMTIDASTGRLCWQPDGRESLVTIHVDDGRGGFDRQSFTLRAGDAPEESGATDEDEDGYDSTFDCDDRNPDVNPGREEIPGNGIDDDCNPATPDSADDGNVDAWILSDASAYDAGDTIAVRARLTEAGTNSAYPEVIGTLRIVANGETLAEATQSFGTLTAAGRIERNFVLPSEGWPSGVLTAEFEARYGDEVLASTESRFEIRDEALDLYARLSGPSHIESGRPATFELEVRNDTDRELSGLVFHLEGYTLETGESVLSESEVAVQLGVGETRNFEWSTTIDGIGPHSLLASLELDGERIGLDQIPVVVSGAGFLRGDANSEGRPYISDALITLSFLFTGA